MEPIYEEMKRLTDLLSDFIVKYDFEDADIEELNDCIEAINDYMGADEEEVVDEAERVVEE